MVIPLSAHDTAEAQLVHTYTSVASAARANLVCESGIRRSMNSNSNVSTLLHVHCHMANLIGGRCAKSMHTVAQAGKLSIIGWL